jgi:penicillin-binding protein 1A
MGRPRDWMEGRPRRAGLIRRIWSNPFTKILAAVFTVFAIGMGFLWHNCGLRGCPDLDRLRGYMPDAASVIVDHQGQEVGKLYLTERVLVSLDSLPKYVPNAFIAMEDRRFWKHNGVDWQRVLGAAWKNLTSFEIQEGSSTITMQLARNAFPKQLPADQKTVWRKVGEMRVARALEQEFSKEEILGLYINQIYFGNGAYGIEAAAREYFGKSAATLSLAEAAMLAALPRAPSRLNPRSNPDMALHGRQVVLDRMLAEHMIGAAEAASAKTARLRLKRGSLGVRDRAPYFVEAVRRRLENELGDALYTEGYTIHTTLDQRAQSVAEAELRAQMEAIESGRYGPYRHITYAAALQDTAADLRGTPYLQAAVVIMDANSGDVRALIGGRDFSDSQFNRATQAERQPGSAFKPFVYAAAVTAGFPPSHRLMDTPIRLALDNMRSWEPKNYDGSYAGVVTVRDALVYSRNVPTVRLAMEVGLPRVIETARKAGLRGHLPNAPSVVLGAAEVTPLDLTAAYATFATLGQRPEPRLVTRVIDRNRNVVWSQDPVMTNALEPAAAYLVTNMLQDVINRGTATAVRGVGFHGVAAGKTGTTNDAADIWFVGYTPRLVTTVWMGFDKRKTILRGATGGELAAPLWGRIMQQLAGYTADWPVPPGVEVRLVDNYGNLIGANCPLQGAVHEEYFLTGTAPFAACYANPNYTYTDTAGWGVDTLDSRTVPWWQRIRRKLFGHDSAQPGAPRDTGVIRTDTGPRLLGRPVQPGGTTGRPPTDTTQRRAPR